MPTRTNWLYTEPQPTRAAAAIEFEAQVQTARESGEDLHQLAGVEVIVEDVDGPPSTGTPGSRSSAPRRSAATEGRGRADAARRRSKFIRASCTFPAGRS